MNRLTLFCAMLRKDLRLFWPFGALISGLLLLRQFPDVIAQLGVVAALMQIAIQLGVVLLMLVVCYEDAVVSLQHDWLTRPISGVTVLMAKVSFVVLFILVPSIIGALANTLYEGGSLAESLVRGYSQGASGALLLTIAIVMAFASVTTGIRQGIIVFLAGIAVLAIATLLFSLAGGEGESAGATGSNWVQTLPLILLLLAATLLVLWVQYGRRHTRTARIIVAAAVVIGGAYTAFMSWPRVYAVQAMLSPDPASAASAQVELASGCFPVRSLDSAGSRAVLERFSDEQRRLASADAMLFSTQLVRTGVPAGHRVHIGRVSIVYRNPRGEALTLHPGGGPALWTTVDQGLLAASHSWLLSNADYARLAATEGIQTQIQYWLNLLEPRSEARFVADGRRQYYSGIGYCSATHDAALKRVDVDCYKAGFLPAQLMANLEGAPEIDGRLNSYPDYTPKLLNFWGGRRYSMQLPVSSAGTPRIRITAYAAKAHFERQFIVPGVLGGAVSACPIPQA